MPDDFINLSSLPDWSKTNDGVQENRISLLSLENPDTPFSTKCAILLLEILSSYAQAEESKRGFHKVNMSLMTKILTRNGIDIETRLISMMLNWKKAVGETYFQATVPQRYDKRNKKLYLHVKHSTWANHLQMTRNTFIDTLHKKLPDFQIQDILAQFKELTRRDWKLHTGRLAGLVRQGYSLKDKEMLLSFLAKKQEVRQMTKHDRECCTGFLKEFLAQQYANNPLIKELVLFNVPASFVNLAEDWEVHQEIQKQELLQEVKSQPLPNLNREVLQKVSDTSRKIDDPELRTAFTELMSFAKRSGLESSAESRPANNETSKGENEATD